MASKNVETEGVEIAAPEINCRCTKKTPAVVVVVVLLCLMLINSRERRTKHRRWTVAAVKLWDNPENVSLNSTHTITSAHVSVTDSLWTIRKSAVQPYMYPAL